MYLSKTHQHLPTAFSVILLTDKHRKVKKQYILCERHFEPFTFSYKAKMSIFDHAYTPHAQPLRYTLLCPGRQGIKAMLLSDVCLSVAYIGPNSRTETPRKTKIGTEVAHVTRDSDTECFQGQKVKGPGHQAALLTAALAREAVQR